MSIHHNYTIPQRIIYTSMAIMVALGIRRLNAAGLDTITLLMMLYPLFIYVLYVMFMRKST